MLSIKGAGGGKPEGQYVWEKYEYTPPVCETITANAPDLKLQMYSGSGVQALAIYFMQNILDSSITEDLISAFLDGYSFVDGNSVERIFNYTDEGVLMLDTAPVVPEFTDGYVVIKNYYPYIGAMVLPSSKYMTATYPEDTKEVAKVITPAVKTLKCFTLNDDGNKYPDKGVYTDGYYYKLLAQVTSANVMSLSDTAVAVVQQDYRDQIETEVSDVNS